MNLPPLNEKQKAFLKNADPDELSALLWKLQFESIPEWMNKVDIMLIDGMTPERILRRSSSREIPDELLAALHECLRWRLRQLKQRAEHAANN